MDSWAIIIFICQLVIYYLASKFIGSDIFTLTASNISQIESCILVTVSFQE